VTLDNPTNRVATKSADKEYALTIQRLIPGVIHITLVEGADTTFLGINVVAFNQVILVAVTQRKQIQAQAPRECRGGYAELMPAGLRSTTVE
jgi:hypothetical protein